MTRANIYKRCSEVQNKKIFFMRRLYPTTRLHCTAFTACVWWMLIAFMSVRVDRHSEEEKMNKKKGG